MRIDRAKLEKAKRLLGVANDAEALDRALDLVVSKADFDETLRGIGGKGHLKKIFR